MAHHVDPMDIDGMDCDYDKENTYHHSNVLSRTPCTEKGYEELDVSELTMKLKYSLTPTGCSMSKSFTANCNDNRNNDFTDDLNNMVINDNNNLTRSLNSSLTKTDTINKSKVPLQVISTEQFGDNNRNVSVLRPLDSTVAIGEHNITVTVSDTHDIDENLSLSSSSSSATHTPKAATPTKEIPKDSGGSPIMRGLKSVFNMFRSSQSPIPPADDFKPAEQMLNPTDITLLNETTQTVPQTMSASTPKAAHKSREAHTPKRSSPHKDSIEFHDDLEKELQWKDETTIIFSKEKIPIHKLFLPQTKSTEKRNKNISVKEEVENVNVVLDNTVEYMDISNNTTLLGDKTMTDHDPTGNDHIAAESDNEFLDCETTFTKNESQLFDSDTKQFKDTKAQNSPKSNVTIDSVVNKEVENIKLPVALNITKPSETVFLTVAAEKPKNETDFKNEQIPSTVSVINQDEENLIDIVNTINNTTSISELENDSIIVCQNTMQQLNINMTSENNQNVCSEANNVTNTNEELHVTLVTELNSENISQADIYLAEVNKSLVTKSDITVPHDNIDISTTYHVNANVSEEVAIHNSHDVSIAAEAPLPDEDENDLSLTYDISWENKNITKHSLSDVISDIETYIQLENIHLDKKEINNSNVESKIDANITVDNNTLSQITEFQCQQYSTTFDEVKITENLAPDAQNLVFTIPTSLELNIDQNVSNVQDFKLVDNESKSNVQILHNDHKIQFDIEHNKIKLNDLSSILKAEEIIGNTHKENSVPESTLQNVVEVKVSSETFYSSTDDVINSSLEVVIPNVTEENRNDVPALLSNELSLDKLPLLEKENVIQVTAINENKDSNETCEVPISVMPVVTELKDTEKVNNLECNKQDVGLSTNESLDNTDVATQNSINDTVFKTYVDNDDHHQNKTENISTVMDIVHVSNSNSINNINVSKNNIKELASSHISELYIPTISNKDFENITVCSEASTIEKNKLQTSVIGTDKQEILLKDDANLINDKLGMLTLNESIVVNLSDHDRITHTSMDNDTITKNITVEETLNVNTEVPVVEKLDIACQLEDSKQPVQNTEENEDFVHNIATVDEEIIISENNSPYVSVTEVGIVPEEKPIENFDEILNPLATLTKVIASPPISPKIVSKGQYNFNFDEIVDPFSTKTKIRMSPPPGFSSNQSFQLEDVNNISMKAKESKKHDKNRRKSQPTQRKPINNKKNFNRTFDGMFASTDVQSDKVNEIQSTLSEDIKSNESQVKTVELKEANKCEIVSQSPHADKGTTITVDNSVSILEVPGKSIPTEVCKEKCDNRVTVNNTTDNVKKEIEIKVDTKGEDKENIGTDENISSIESASTISNKNVSSSEQSTYYSANASSTEAIISKSVFNLPEIDDMNFNPFVTKTKISQSPPLTSSIEDPVATNSKITDSPNSSLILTKSYVTTNVDSTEEFSLNYKENKDKEKFNNISDTTVCSKVSDKDCTVLEVHTEDEDTIEGPFLEVDDLKDLEKLSDCDTEKPDIINFNDIPAEENESGEMFIDAEAFDFLMSQNNEIVDSGKESLFLKFDPLFARRVTSDGVAAVLSEIQNKQTTPQKMIQPPQRDLLSLEKPVETTKETNNIVDSVEEPSATVSKPMMAVPPAVNPVVTPRTKTTTPSRTNRRSMTFTSPAMTVIDRLLSLSSNNSLMSHDSPTTHVRERSEADLALTQLRELLAEKEIHVHHLRTESIELKDRLATLESHMKTLETENETRARKVHELSEQLTEKTKINKSMAIIVEKYESTIARLIAKTEQDKKTHLEERMKLTKERDEQTVHLASMEASFSDLHSKYEKSKQLILTYKANEDKYKESVKEFEENLEKMQNNYALLKQHATSQLNHANHELGIMNRTHEAEVLKLNAMIKRKDLHITSLEETLTQKIKANEELTAICDELINKVG